MAVLVVIAKLDLSIFTWCHNRPSSISARLARLVSRSADGPLYVLAGIGLAAADLLQLLAVLVASFTLERGCYWICKNACKRGRPPVAIPGFKSFIEPADQFSFPSGHTSGAFLMAWVASTAYPGGAAFLYVWAVAVGAARVRLGVHFPSDIVAGAALGTAVVASVDNFGIDLRMLT